MSCSKARTMSHHPRRLRVTEADRLQGASTFRDLAEVLLIARAVVAWMSGRIERVPDKCTLHLKGGDVLRMLTPGNGASTWPVGGGPC